ncbi:MAG: glycogen/starch/alpha-glucan phosphorylase [Acidobacteriota bacterium]|nr:glycogen/starch/alpha-glucan phosphorylase [Acidobacteriota bacterium]
MALYPERFCNVTNGVTPRRFVALSNPGLAGLLTERLSERWLCHLEDLRALEPLAADAAFQAGWRHVKHLNKVCLADLVRERTGVTVELDGRQRGQRHRQHEDGDERRADHRHARRRQHRDP